MRPVLQAFSWAPRTAVLLASCVCSAAGSDFDRTIRPLLSERCGSCHSDEEKSSGFSVASLPNVVAGGEKLGTAVVPGHPERSPLVQVLRGVKKPRMPLRGSLSEEDIARVEAWIRSLSNADVSSAHPDDPRGWAFRRPARPELPSVRRADWVRNPIDAFVLKRLEAAGLEPAPPADHRVLARRVYLDLVGIVPSPEELESFLADGSPRAYERLVDRLLDDPRYGERWGRHWLDLVRYGETSGLEGDGPIGNAWRYRDWVIDAFNSDMPYDRFVIQQLAGADEHSRTRLNYQPDVQGHIPTGFLRLAPWDRSNLVAAEVRQNYLNEITGATGSIFLGLTIGCAQCHDHKYDPIPQRDYYRLQAFFSTVQVANDLEVPYTDRAFAAHARRKIEEYEKTLQGGPEKKELDALLEQLRARLIAARKAQAAGKALTSADLRLELRRDGGAIFGEAERQRHEELLDAAKRTGDLEQQQALGAYEETLLKKLERAYSRPGVDPLARFEALTVEDVEEELEAPYSSRSFFSDEEQTRYRVLSSKLQVVRSRLGRWKPVALTVRNVPGPPNGPGVAPTHLLFRGDYRQPKEEVKPGFPSVLTGHSDPAVIEADRYRQFPTRGWRMTLARWIASPENPLTARVMVNRIWQQHFGRGIVATPSDFGKNGEPPSHPELLDWLAHAFIERGWSIKAMHRLILQSSTYRQSAENPSYNENRIDPENRLLWRFNRWRLEAEAVRDSILSISGQLNPERGGPSVFPPLPDDLADFARYGRTGSVVWEPNEAEAEGRRRSVYIFQRRSLPLPMMAAFDAPVFSESCARRSVTTTPLQALSLLNGSLVQEASRALARRVEAEAGPGRRAQVVRACERVLNRSPDPAEIEDLLRFAGPLEGICRVLFNTNEFLYVD
ncbi:MAG: PSD1 and planctomycete cytochrome C domain-containing protein [Isosphaeraceae bacterium]